MTATAGRAPTPVSILDLRGAALIIRRVARWAPLDSQVRVALEAEAVRLEETLRRVRTVERITEGDQ